MYKTNNYSDQTITLTEKQKQKFIILGLSFIITVSIFGLLRTHNYQQQIREQQSITQNY